TLAEGNSGPTPFSFTVTRTGDTSSAATVKYAVTGSGANAANATDFTGSALPTATVTLAAGVSSQVITINVNGDSLVEPDEGFTATLSNASAPASITTATATGLIQNDDATTLSVSIANVTQVEGNSGPTPFVFTLSRSGDTSVATSVKYAVTGSGTNAANAN